MIKSAVISNCKTFRYILHREWNDDLPCLGFVMLNPSTADADNDDPTIRKCIGFAERLGYGGIVVTNLFAYRATDPKQLKKAGYPVGGMNDYWIKRMADSCGEVICAWGANARGMSRVNGVLRFIDRPMALSLLTDGTPQHPLYIPYINKPVALDVL